MKKIFQSGIRQEVVVNMTVLAVVAIVLSSLFTYKLLERHLMAEEIENAKVFANGIRDRMQFVIQIQSLETENKQLILQQVGQFFDVDYLKRIIITDFQAKILAQVGQGDMTSAVFLDEAMKADMLEAMRGRLSVTRIEGVFSQVFKSGPTVTVFLPVVVQNRLWGGVAVSIEIKGFRGVTNAVYKYFSIFMIMVICVLAIFGSVIMSKLIVYPVLELVKGTRRLSQGDLETRVEVHANNELGELGASFNYMSQRLRDMIVEREVNLTELKAINERLTKTQRDLVRNEKLAAVGRIAAGVAHEIGNPIGAIMGYTEILKDTPLPETSQDFLRRIDQEAKRIDRMIRDLLNISRPREALGLGAVNIKQTIELTLDLLKSQESFKNVEVLYEAVPGELCLFGDAHQVQQIFINLFSNAAQAMTDAATSRPTLTLSVKAGIFNEYKHIQFHAGAAATPLEGHQPVIVMEVSDTGPGIEADILGQIFEPFFTTRDPGQGTGLGLYIVSRILEAMNARIAVESTRGRGTKIVLLFPEEK